MLCAPPSKSLEIVSRTDRPRCSVLEKDSTAQCSAVQREGWKACTGRLLPTSLGYCTLPATSMNVFERPMLFVTRTKFICLTYA
jgi:hypothetical protein